MNMIWRFHVVGGQLTLFNEEGKAIVSVGPAGREPDVPIGTAGPYEVCTLSGACVVYSPTTDTKFVFAPND